MFDMFKVWFLAKMWCSESSMFGHSMFRVFEVRYFGVHSKNTNILNFFPNPTSISALSRLRHSFPLWSLFCWPQRPFLLWWQLLRMRSFQGFWAQYGRHLVSSLLLCLPSNKGPKTMITRYYCLVLAVILVLTGAEARLEFPERYAGKIFSWNSVVSKHDYDKIY